VACPFFKPVRLIEWSSGRAPLNGMFEGVCEQGGATDARLCNFGYARNSCVHFSDGPDAVRFSVARRQDGVVKLVWILEKDHSPAEHGLVEYRESSGEFVEALRSPLEAQARAFVEQYLRR
jgi:hypothetical protein